MKFDYYIKIVKPGGNYKEYYSKNPIEMIKNVVFLNNFTGIVIEHFHGANCTEVKFFEKGEEMGEKLEMDFL